AELIAAILTSDQHSVVRSRDGRAGMERFCAEPFDLVITDILMPNQEGLETIRSLVKQKPDVRIIAVSGSGRDGGVDYLRIAQEFGAIGALQKPFQPEDLLRLVHQAQQPAVATAR
ncbi:MAG: response regulator, partial [Ferrovibrio sp.]